MINKKQLLCSATLYERQQMGENWVPKWGWLKSGLTKYDNLMSKGLVNVAWTMDRKNYELLATNVRQNIWSMRQPYWQYSAIEIDTCRFWDTWSVPSPSKPCMAYDWKKELNISSFISRALRWISQSVPVLASLTSSIECAWNIHGEDSFSSWGYWAQPCS